MYQFDHHMEVNIIYVCKAIAYYSFNLIFQSRQNVMLFCKAPYQINWKLVIPDLFIGRR